MNRSISFQSFGYSYPGYSGLDRFALDDVNVSLREGEFALIAGASGSGKTTFLRAIAGTVPKFYGGKVRGSLNVLGRDAKSSEMSSKVAFAFQDPEDQLVMGTVEEEVAFGLENIGAKSAEMRLKVEEMLISLGLSGIRSNKLEELSCGQKQKVVLASVLAMHPKILLLDEPTSQLDPVSSEDLLTTLRRVNEETGLTILIAEHRTDRCLHFADRIIFFEDGKIIFDGSASKFVKSEREKFIPFFPPVARLFNGLKDVAVPLTVKDARKLLNQEFSVQIKSLPERGNSSIRERTVKIEKLQHSYSSGSKSLKGVTLDLFGGEFVAVVGENGAGKSTLVRHLNGLLKPSSGTVNVCGTDSKFGVEVLSEHCGLLTQNPNDYLFSDTVLEELMLSLSYKDVKGSEAENRAIKILEEVDLVDLAGADPRSLSGGQRQRVALASVLVSDPRIIVLDEPTRGMDPLCKENLGLILKRFAERGKTVILVSHDVEFISRFADRVVVMGGGRVIADGPARKVLSGSFFSSPQVNRLMGDAVEGILTVEEARSVIREVAR